jgi:hypothetical protein
VSMAYIRRHYGVPAKRGARIEYAAFEQPKPGTIVGSKGAHLRIRLDGQKRIRTYHPTFLIKYLEQGQ